MHLIKTNNDEYRIEGLTDIQVLRIFSALKVVNDKYFILELDTMINCLKIDMLAIERGIKRNVL